jgi:hypothetical protein
MESQSREFNRVRKARFAPFGNGPWNFRERVRSEINSVFATPALAASAGIGKDF